MAPRVALPAVKSFIEALQLAFSYINVSRLQHHVEVPDTKFVLENTCNNYSVLVEARQKGNRCLILFKSFDLKGFQAQGAGDEKSIKIHIFGKALATEASYLKDVIARESRGRQLTCWYVHYTYLDCGTSRRLMVDKLASATGFALSQVHVWD
ncbi:hypothetical protein SELMODRAFT_409765 [Selaginella moellendorffii]|uniref:Uncharacterized protein n=1 Tax=Selaginella moellendorffii TaxID=88036 RepID=D8RCD8_SELML|nr:hypothetical protein SELMODRAFT_409765 [Selaginella moellendorffii]